VSFQADPAESRNPSNFPMPHELPPESKNAKKQPRRPSRPPGFPAI